MRNWLIVLIALLISSCLSTPSTPIPTQSFFVTESAQEKHQWDAQPVVLQLYDGAPYTEDSYAWSVLPRLVIYADGRLIITKRSFIKHAWMDLIKISHISSYKICSLLAEIDDSGFFEFDLDDYVSPDVYDGGSTHIVVNAWQSRSVRAYEIESATNIPSALEMPYLLLLKQSAPSLYPKAVDYQADRIALYIEFWGKSNKGGRWPISLPLLRDFTIGLDVGEYTVVTLTGQNAIRAMDLFAQEPNQVFNENGLFYKITFRPLLPQEIAESVQGWSPSMFEDSPTTNLTCYSSN